MRFYLGTHETSWLGRTDVPLFVSHRRLCKRKRMPVALGPWALDSGGFTELNLHGRWVTTEAEYIAAARRYAAEIGGLEWAAPMDWMCEPFVVAKTGENVEAHQQHTVDNYVRLRAAAPDLPFIPVLQGWALDDYLRCIDLYERAGVDLRTLAVVGIGSVCRRQDTAEVDQIVSAVAHEGIALHGFGVKLTGIGLYAEFLASSDSMAWSYTARHRPPMAGCPHRSCANCLRFALAWRLRVVARSDTYQTRMNFSGAVA